MLILLKIKLIKLFEFFYFKRVKSFPRGVKAFTAIEFDYSLFVKTDKFIFC